MSTKKDNNQEKLSQLDKVNLGFGILAIVLLTAALGAGYLPQASRPPYNVIQALQWAGYGAMALYVITLAILKKADIKQAASHKHTASGANSTIQIVAVLAILAAVNWWGTRYHQRFDLTENKQYSLSQQSIKIVKDLKEPVNVQLFLKTGDSYSTNLKNLWDQYQYQNPDKLKVETIDVDKNPMVARAAKVTAYGTSLLKRGERSTTITGSQEQDLTSALLKVTQSGQKIVYFTTGHGELAYDKMDKDGLSSAKDALEKQNYKIDTLLLVGKKTIPTDAALVVVAGPTKPFSDEERAALKNYIDKGGRVFLSLQPQSDPKLDPLLKDFGIIANNDVVLDPRANVGDLAAPVAQKFPFHAITTGLQAAYFTGTRSLAKMEKLPAGVNITPLVESSGDAWGETNFMERQIAFNPGDHKGPLPIMLLAEKDKGRLIVSGNTQFAANANYVNLNNGDLFLNSLNWMADEASLVAIPPKDNQPKTVDLLPWQYQGVFYGTVLLLPLSLLLMAGFVWWKRR
jgi:ABC-type uncharacterized transport system involved in gliding motility auxiliary subunit